ncbi:MAG: hypothetical protein ACLFVN_12930 [Phycisphaeraceae bacterium]
MRSDPDEAVNHWNAPRAADRKAAMPQNFGDRMGVICAPLPLRVGIF